MEIEKIGRNGGWSRKTTAVPRTFYAERNKVLNILISSAGRRVELMQCFRESLRSLNTPGKLYATDCSGASAACLLADQYWQVPRCSKPEFIPALLDLAERENITVIIPTIDSELGSLAQHKNMFTQKGIHVSVSSADTVHICGDKVATHRWLCANGFPTVRQCFPEEVLNAPQNWTLPLIAKPRYGSASKGVRVIETWDELSAYAAIRSDLIVQQVAVGDEHTVNIFVNRDGKCICAVPHRRIETRGGEVSKAITVRHIAMMTLACDIAERLPGARGMLNLQCFLSAEGDIRIIEINARAGGGYPLTHSAGARQTLWILEELLGIPVVKYFEDWRDDLAMLRYDQAVIRPASELRAFDFKSATLSGVGSR
jgi:carbamoyl-phosphate synthase large subunit